MVYKVRNLGNFLIYLNDFSPTSSKKYIWPNVIQQYFFVIIKNYILLYSKNLKYLINIGYFCILISSARYLDIAYECKFSIKKSVEILDFKKTVALLCVYVT